MNFFSFYQDRLQNEAMIIGYPVIDLGYRPNNPSRCKDTIEAQGLAIAAKTGTNTKNMAAKSFTGTTLASGSKRVLFKQFAVHTKSLNTTHHT